MYSDYGYEDAYFNGNDNRSGGSSMGFGRGGNYGGQRRGQGGRGNFNGGGYGRGGNRNYGRGNGRNGGNNRSADSGNDYKYVLGLFTKNVIYENEAQEGQKPPKEEVKLVDGETEELNITINAEDVPALKRKIQEAVDDPSGDGGIVIKAYAQTAVSQRTGNDYQKISVLVLGKYPNQNGNGYQGRRGGGGGRRDYPERDAAREDTRQSGRNDRGDQTQDSQRDGRTQDAPNDAYRSEGGSESNYTEDQRW